MYHLIRWLIRKWRSRAAAQGQTQAEIETQSAAPGGEVSGSVALSVNGLTKHFGDRVAFSDVSFEVGYGEVFGFLGTTAPGRRRPCARWARCSRPPRARPRFGEVRVAQQLGALASFPSVLVTALIAYSVIPASLGLAIGGAVLLLLLNGLGWRVTSAAFQRERLISGTR
jgi:hypothetical protein